MMKSDKQKRVGRPALKKEEKKARRLITFDPEFLEALDEVEGKRPEKIQEACTEYFGLKWKKKEV